MSSKLLGESSVLNLLVASSGHRFAHAGNIASAASNTPAANECFMNLRRSRYTDFGVISDDLISPGFLISMAIHSPCFVYGQFDSQRVLTAQEYY
jgi:hypothetical protein